MQEHVGQSNPVIAEHVGPQGQSGQGTVSGRSLGAKLPEHIGQGLLVRAKAPRDVRACLSEQSGHRRACRSLGAKRSGQGQRSVPRGKAARAYRSGLVGQSKGPQGRKSMSVRAIRSSQSMSVPMGKAVRAGSAVGPQGQSYQSTLVRACRSEQRPLGT